MSATSGDLEAQVDPRFGRCPYFVIVDIDTMKFEAIPNTSATAMASAGIQAAQTLVQRGVQAIITGNVGPNAYQALSPAGVRIVVGVSGTVRDVVEKFKSGQLQEMVAPGPVGPGMGMGMARGMGPGMGMGRGMGRGRGRGMGLGMGRGMGGLPATMFPQTPVSPASPPVSMDQEISLLEDQMKSLRQQLEQIRKRLDELKGSTSR